MNIFDELEQHGWKATVSAYPSGLRTKSLTRVFDQRIPGHKRPDIVELKIEGNYKYHNADSEPNGYWLWMLWEGNSSRTTLLWFQTIEEVCTAATAILAGRDK